MRDKDAQRIIEAKQDLRKANNNIGPSQSVTTPYTSRTENVRWYEKQKEYSRPCNSERGSSEEKVLLLAKSTEWTQTKIKI